MEEQERLRVRMGSFLDQWNASRRDFSQVTREIKDRFQAEYKSRKIPMPDGSWDIRRVMEDLGAETVVEKGQDLLDRYITLEAGITEVDESDSERLEQCAKQITPRPGSDFHPIAIYELNQGALMGIISEAMHSRGFSLEVKPIEQRGHHGLVLHIGVESEIDLAAASSVVRDLEERYYANLSD